MKHKVTFAPAPDLRHLNYLGVKPSFIFDDEDGRPCRTMVAVYLYCDRAGKRFAITEDVEEEALYSISLVRALRAVGDVG